ncbi:hypothetical protein K461DRAFT_324980 [Myriangium duriaei CBS 260.36]|uniref:Uncharacterized protein n=1 Tax=Myriangium duriaei CBS 260.36 TaxID=1168546 RepID=A0A9P4IW94_9PEZI|nr:hypothetical protein K461DRAFT_324980 [Myriangium duriaei CBS 260.36]
MGTRHIIFIFYKGEWVLAQVGQWDGYPEGQGVRILRFLTTPGKIDKLIAALDNNMLRQINEDEFNHLATTCKVTEPWIIERSEWEQDERPIFPASLDRETSSKLFDLIIETTEPLLVFHEPKSLFARFCCEWAYVVDLDARRFEVYSETDRPAEGYNPHIEELAKKECGRAPPMIACYSLDELPSETQFLQDTSDECRDDEDGTEESIDGLNGTDGKGIV